MKILLLGAGGMLGQDLVKVFIGDELYLGDMPDWDITEPDELREKISGIKPEIVINCAAYTDVEGAEDNRESAFAVNAEGVRNLAAICKSFGCVLVQISTEYVFEGTKRQGYDESDDTSAINVYGQSKAKGEEYLAGICQNYYLVRSSWLIGHAPQKGKPRGLNFVDKMLELGERQTSVRIVNDQFGKPTFTKDLSLAIRQLIEDKYPYGIYHLVNEGVASWYDLAKEVFRLKNMKVEVLPISSVEYPSKVSRPKCTVLNNHKFPILKPWQEALKEYLTI